jgi:hypothetical protein
MCDLSFVKNIPLSLGWMIFSRRGNEIAKDARRRVDPAIADSNPDPSQHFFRDSRGRT